MRRRRFQSASRREFEYSDRDWASRSLPLALPRESRGTFAWLTWAAPASPACCGPPCLSAVGEPDDSGSMAREPPSCGRDTTSSCSTHTRLGIKVSPVARAPGIRETGSGGDREGPPGTGAWLIGSVRVSTLKQNPDLQEAALKAAGYSMVYADKTDSDWREHS